VPLNAATSDRKPEPQPYAFVLRTWFLIEGIEDVFEMLGRNAVPKITNNDDCLGSVVRHINFYS
jgi:hypothetical protein